jgi:ankyrin repeat protein
MKRILAAILICGGVGVDAQNANPSDAFYAAIRANDLTQLQALLKQGADPNVKDNRGLTPLMQAAIVGSPEAMKLLLANGADANLTNSSGSTALMFSVTDMAKARLLLESGANVNLASKFGRTALLLAAMSDGSAEIVRLLIAKGADVKVADGFKTTALHAAAGGNDTETIRQLIDAGLEVDAVNLAGFTPLMTSASHGNLAAVRMLLAKGANVNAVSNDGSFQKVKAGIIALGHWTPLLLAAPFGPTEVVKTLLDAGAKVNVQDVRGMTPLMLAVGTDRQNLQVIRALVAKGADLNASSLAGETALDWARKVGNKTTIDVLKNAGATETPARPVPLPAFAPTDLKTAVQRSVILLEKSSTTAAALGGCASCHHHNVTDFATSIASLKGIRVDQKAAADRQQLTKAPFFSPLNLLERMDAAGSPDVPLFALAALGSGGYEPDRTTDAIVANLLAHQRADGRWSLGGVARPPIEDSDVPRTFLAISTMKIYAPPGRAKEVAERVGRATKWIAAAKAATAEDRNTQLLALDCAEVDRSVLQRLAKAILAMQRADGGWAQRPGLASDAYATGQTLFALAKTGVISTRAAAYQKGVKYLLSTQHADGSWYVRSRAPKFQPYFESGFPYGHDQWISAMATGWATTALAFAIEEPTSVALMH